MHIRQLSGLLGLSVCAVFMACGGGELKGPEAEVKPHDKKLNLPAIPSFEVPKPNADGSHSVRELRVKGRGFMDTEITVSGTIVWMTDCRQDLKEQGVAPEEIERLLKEDLSKCRRTRFQIADSADVPIEKSLWVVSVPREPIALEKKRLPKAQLDTWLPVVPYKVGDQVVVTGRFGTMAASGERNTEGLLVYKSMKNVTQGVESPPLTEAQAAALSSGVMVAPPGGR